MEMLLLILALSTTMWYVIDRLKVSLWEHLPYGKYITMACAAIFGFGLTFSLNVDLLFALNLTTEVTIAGKILTGFALMSGSSAISEIIARIKGEDEPPAVD